MFIKGLTDTSQRVAKLLDHVKNGDRRRYEDFCKALVKSDQEDIVAYYLECSRPVEARGDATDAVSTDAEDMPVKLSGENKAKLTTSWNDLVGGISSDVGGTLMAKLEDCKVFCSLQLKQLKASNL